MGGKNGQPKGCNHTRVLYRYLEIVMCILPDAAIRWPYALCSNAVSMSLATTKKLTGQLQYERRPSSHYISFGKNYYCSTNQSKGLPAKFIPSYGYCSEICMIQVWAEPVLVFWHLSVNSSGICVAATSNTWQLVCQALHSGPFMIHLW